MVFGSRGSKYIQYRLYLTFHQLQYSIMFCSKGSLTDAGLGYHKKTLGIVILLRRQQINPSY